MESVQGAVRPLEIGSNLDMHLRTRVLCGRCLGTGLRLCATCLIEQGALERCIAVSGVPFKRSIMDCIDLDVHAGSESPTVRHSS